MPSLTRTRPWTGTLSTDLMRRGKIRPGEFSTWDGARRYHERHRYDRGVLKYLRGIAEKHGELSEPLLVGVSEWNRRVFVKDGHHRVVIALELGLPELSFQWFRDPNLTPVTDPFPYRDLRLA